MFLRTIVLVVVALSLLWGIGTASVASYLADAAPETALYLNPNEPHALLNLAGELATSEGGVQAAEPIIAPDSEAKAGDQAAPTTSMLNETVASGIGGQDSVEPTDERERTPDPQVLAEIEQLAKQALAHDPLNAKAMRILGQVAYTNSNEAQGNALMQAAAQRSLRESVALYSMARKSFREGDSPTALDYADALLRTRSGVLPALLPMFGRLAETPDGSGSLKHLLVGNPPWRSQLLAVLPQSVTDARTPLDILLTLKDSSAPPSGTDFLNYLKFLVQKDFQELAYYTWLQLLPPEQLAKAGRVFNGSFETEPSGAPFDWRFNRGSGVTIQRSPRPDNPDELALHVAFGPGRAEFGGVTQTLLLTPGPYRLKATYKSDLVSERGLKWSVRCDGAKEPIGESISVGGVDTQWKELEFTFMVPDTDCTAQILSLVLDARSASEKFVRGSIWYDDVLITQASDRADLPDQALPN